MQFRTNSDVVDAWQLPHPDVKVSTPLWILKAVVDGKIRLLFDPPHAILVAAGNARVDVGDWIVRSSDGELLPCSADGFATKYKVEPPAPPPRPPVESDPGTS